MKKKLMISLTAGIAIACIIVIIFIRFGNKGNISNVKRVIGYSALYDEELINKAFDAVEDAVEDKFASDFKGCTLTELRYDENVENRFSDEMMEYNAIHKKELMIVLSDFDTSRKSKDLGFTPNETYEGWSWSLVRTDNQQEWEVHKKELMIVLSDFDTSRKSKDLGFTPNETYEGWSWSLVRTDNQQEWEVVEGGWGY